MPTLVYVIAIAVLVLIFVLVWRLDAKRARREVANPERLDVEPRKDRRRRR